MKKRDVTMKIQKLIGIGLLIFGVVLMPIGLGTVSLILIPMALFAIFSKKSYLADEYYVESEDEES